MLLQPTNGSIEREVLNVAVSDLVKNIYPLLNGLYFYLDMKARPRYDVHKYVCISRKRDIREIFT